MDVTLTKPGDIWTTPLATLPLHIHTEYDGGKQREGVWLLLPVPGGRPSLSRHKTTSFPEPQGGSSDANEPIEERDSGLSFLSFTHYAVGLFVTLTDVSASSFEVPRFDTAIVLDTLYFF